MRYRIALGSAFVIGAVLRLAALSLTSLIDDAFMYFDVARTLGTAGRLSTSGIQPLYLLLITPIYAVLRPESIAQLDVAARVSVTVGAIGDLVALALLARLLWKLGGPTASAIGAWIWAVHPGAIGFASNGMETSWALAAFLGVVLVADERRDLLAGVAVAVAMLARIDLAATGVAVAVCVLWDARREPTVALRRIAAVAAGWCVVYLPWLAFQFAQTGDLLPISGSATHLLGEPHRTFEGADVGLPFPVIMFGLACAAAAFSAPLVAIGAVAALSRIDLRRLRVPLLAGAVLLMFYVCFHGVAWYLTRYLAPLLVVEVVVVALAVATLGSVLRRTLVGVAVVSCAAIALVAIAAPTIFDYRAAALEVRDWALPGRLAAPESGALSYYLPGQIVNADGVLNHDAYAAMRSHRLAQYFLESGIDRVVLRRTAEAIFPEFSAPFSTTTLIDGQRGFNVVRIRDSSTPAPSAAAQ